MKRHALAVAAMLIIPVTPVAAQQPGAAGAAALKVYNWCMRLPTGSVSECSCVARFFAGATEEDEYQVIGALVDFIGPDGAIADPDGVLAAITAHQQSVGLSDERLSELMERFLTFGELGEKSDAICVPVKDHARNASAG